MILRTSGIGVSIAFLREAQWGSRGREFDSRHSDHKSNDFTLEIVGFFCLWADLIWFWPQCQRFYLVDRRHACLDRMPVATGTKNSGRLSGPSGKTRETCQICAEKIFPVSFLQDGFFVGNVEDRSGIYAFSPTKSAQTCWYWEKRFINVYKMVTGWYTL